MIVRKARLLFFFLFIAHALFAQQRPNIIFILTDDMGFGDISSFNGSYATPNIDRLAAQGRRFTNYYSMAPICSPSRVGFMTGMSPAKWNITSYLQTKAGNRQCGQADYLASKAPSIARVLQENGYATAHFGKWHMGGGRDVKDAPSISSYGFDEYHSTWESPDPDPLLTASNWIWSDKDSIKRWDRTDYFVDKTLAFLEKNKGKPCFINLWPDDVHTPWVPGPEDRESKPDRDGEENFVAVLKEYDRQIGRLMQGLKDLKMEETTLIIFTSDNGPMPNFRHGRSGGMRGSKLSLYEGGTRMPFIASWTGRITPGTVDSSSVICAADLFVSFCTLAKAALPKTYRSDGEDRSAVILGKPQQRKKEIYWEYGRSETGFAYPAGKDRSPSLAIREGAWKLLMNRDGSAMELYNIVQDKNETQNLVPSNLQLAERLKNKLLRWWARLPSPPQK